MAVLGIALLAFLALKHFFHALVELRRFIIENEEWFRKYHLMATEFAHRHRTKILIASIMLDIGITIHYGDSIRDYLKNISICGSAPPSQEADLSLQQLIERP